MTEIKVNRRKLSEYLPDPANLNRGTLRGLAMHEQSVEEFGAARSAVADRNDVLLAGNKTAERLIDAGIDDVIEVETDGKQFVIVKRMDLDATTERGKRYAIADNRTGELNLDWDAEQMQALLDGGVDLAQFFDDDELAGILAGVADEPKADPGPQIDRAEELQAKWQVQRGDLWMIGEHRLVCGDSTRREDVTRVMAGERAQLLASDPPYNVSVEYGDGVDDAKSAADYELFSRGWFAVWSAVSDRQIVTPGCYNLALWLRWFDAYHWAPWTKTNSMTNGKVSRFWCWEPVLFFGEKWNRTRLTTCSIIRSVNKAVSPIIHALSR